MYSDTYITIVMATLSCQLTQFYRHFPSMTNHGWCILFTILDNYQIAFG
jgi:hypothetical protein